VAEDVNQSLCLYIGSQEGKNNFFEEMQIQKIK